ncbi:hypothetical protein ACHAQH_007968 [Verticillium albo-atrum]
MGTTIAEMANNFSKLALADEEDSEIPSQAREITTFHPFPRLPPELRNNIWHEALRDLSQPGVHYLSHDHTNLTADPSVYIKSSPYALLPSFVPKPIHDARSSYTHDYGLFSACRESRPIVTHHYSIPLWNAILPVLNRVHATGSYPRTWHNPSRVLAGASTLDKLSTGFAIRPHADLVLYKPRLANEPFPASAQSWFFEHSPWTAHPLGAANIALDLDAARTPVLASASRGPVLVESALFARLPRLLRHGAKVWLVDSEITPDPEFAGPPEGERAVFTGIGVRYTEVREGDARWRHGPRGDFPAYSAGEKMATPGALRLVAALERAVRVKHDMETCWMRNGLAISLALVARPEGPWTPGTEMEMCIGCRVHYEEIVRGQELPEVIGLLACETFDG